MYYEINVSKGGKHYFATAERSINLRSKLIEVYEDFRVKFPEPEYEMSVSYWDNRGEMISPEEMKEMMEVS